MLALSRKCQCIPTQIASAQSGGDDGFASHIYFSRVNFNTRVAVNFNPYGIPDRLQIYSPDQTQLLLDTQCCSNSPEVYENVVINPTPLIIVLEAGWSSIYVIVIGSCHGGSGTAWDLYISTDNTPDCYGRDFK